MASHAAALHACIAAGVKIAVGADLNSIGGRLHRELELLEYAGMDRLAVLHAASVGGRELNGFGADSTPEPGAVADLILLKENPMSTLEALRMPELVIAHGRIVARRGTLLTGGSEAAAGSQPFDDIQHTGQMK